MLTRSYNDELGASSPTRSAPTTAGRRDLLPRKQNRVRVATRWWHCVPGSAAAPSSGIRSPADRCWFNQIGFLNEWTMAPEVHEYLVDVYGADGLPFNTRFGNGDPIGEDVVQLLNDAYEANTVREPVAGR